VAAMACERELSITIQLWVTKRRNSTIHWCSAQSKEALNEEMTERIRDRSLQCNESIVDWFVEGLRVDYRAA
jgi:hypothetical protein